MLYVWSQDALHGAGVAIRLMLGFVYILPGFVCIIHLLSALLSFVWIIDFCTMDILHSISTMGILHSIGAMAKLQLLAILQLLKMRAVDFGTSVLRIALRSIEAVTF